MNQLKTVQSLSLEKKAYYAALLERMGNVGAQEHKQEEEDRSGSQVVTESLASIPACSLIHN